MRSRDTICPVCGDHYFEEPQDFDVCPICGWENDGVQRAQNDFWGGANDLSVNEAKVMYSLLHNEGTKGKASEILDKYKQRRIEIYTLYRGIDHRTTEGEKFRNAFAEAHNDLIIALEKLSKTQQ
jgi:hypothetical protein